jgi:hypothetical protein
MTTFQNQLAIALQHVLRPILEYVAELYELPPDIIDGNSPSPENYKLVPTSEEFNVESEPIIHRILHVCRDSTSNNLNNSGHIWKSTIKFFVPAQEENEFWKEAGFSGINGDVKYENSTLLWVTAFGSSKRDAESIATTKLIHLIELLRRILKERHETEDMKSMISKFVKNPARRSCSDITSNEALDIGVQLFKIYSYQHQGSRMNNDVWHSITRSIQAFLKVCPRKLQPLLRYYLVNPHFLFL